MHWFVKKVWAINPCAPASHSTNRKLQNTRVNNLEPITFPFYYDQLVADADWNGHLDTVKVPIYVSEKDNASIYPTSK